MDRKKYHRHSFFTLLHHYIDAMTVLTEKLYEKDPYLFEFTALVIGMKGDLIELDRTAFYPGGGGQDSDRGELEDLAVVDVRYLDGALVHKVPGHGFLLGMNVRGVVSKERRLDLMKGHTGEHMLFAALNRMVPDLELVKISITPEKKSFLVKGALNWNIILDAEKLVNEAIGQGIGIDDVMVDRKDPLISQSRIKLERIPGDLIRLVRIGEFDLAACAGVHVRNTTDIDMLLVEKLTSARPHGDFEVEFLVGRRAILRSLQLSSWAIQASDLIGSHPEDLLNALRNLKAEMVRDQDALRQTAKTVMAGLVPETISGVPIYRSVFQGVDRKTLSEEATRKVSDGRSICIFADEGEKRSLVIAIGNQLDIDANQLLQKTLLPHGGRGGGNKNFATGGTNISVKGESLLESVLIEIRSLLEK
jgi:alanyl-tRNA synthetase